MKQFIQYNTLYISKKILQKSPYNLSDIGAAKQIKGLKDQGLLFKVEGPNYLFIPTLNKYLSLYGYRFLGLLISNGYIGLYTSAKKWGLVKQEHNENIMYISNIRTYSEYKFNYDKWKFYKYRMFKSYDNALEFGLITENNLIYSDREKTILDLVYYSLYSKYVVVDKHTFELTNIIDINKIKEYINYYPKKSQNRILSKFNLIFHN